MIAGAGFFGRFPGVENTRQKKQASYGRGKIPLKASCIKPNFSCRLSLSHCASVGRLFFMPGVFNTRTVLMPGVFNTRQHAGTARNTSMMKSRILLFSGVLIAASVLMGCHHTPAPAPISAAKPSASVIAPVSLSDKELAKLQVNESGVVPILEYHAIDNGKSTMSRSAAQFRGDLQRLYEEGYRPVALSEYLDNRLAIPAGKSPVIFTFDDARPTQFAYRPDGAVDPDCAIGILQEFHREHSDFALKGTFFVLPTHPGFGAVSVRQQKMQELLKMGFEIGNHTIHHDKLRTLTDAQVQSELAECVREIHKLVPDAKVDTLALPLGIHARNRALEAGGASAGQSYANRAVLLVGAEPAPASASKKFDPLRLPRIQACEGASGITYWLDDLKRHPRRRYVSDGDSGTVTIPKSRTNNLETTLLQGSRLRSY